MVQAVKTTTSLAAPLDNPDDAEVTVEVTDPAEPLYGKRFVVEPASLASESANVFLRRTDGIVLRVLRRATSLSTLVDHAPRARLSGSAAAQFLDLVKEYELCHQTPEPRTKAKSTGKSRRKKSGRRSKNKRNRKS